MKCHDVKNRDMEYQGNVKIVSKCHDINRNDMKCHNVKIYFSVLTLVIIIFRVVFCNTLLWLLLLLIYIFIFRFKKVYSIEEITSPTPLRSNYNNEHHLG